jgi:hypothetical protein
MHVFEFRDGLIPRENVWLDYSALREQLVQAYDLADFDASRA